MAIVAAVDGDTRADRVVAVGADLAEAFDEDLIVLHVMTEGEFERRREDREYFIDDAADDARKTARWVVEGTLDNPTAATIEGYVGKPVDEILELSEDHDARYLVIGGRHRTPVGKAVFGSVTQAVLLNAERPVVTVMNSEE